MKSFILFLVFALLLVGLSESGAQTRVASCIPPVGFVPIRTQQDLDNIRNNLAGNYFLCNDITLQGNFTPLGWTGGIGHSWFVGKFNGNSKRIRNLKVSMSSGYPYENYLGLFSEIAFNGEVKNLVLENPDIAGHEFFGTLAGMNSGLIENVKVRGIGKVKGAANPPPWGTQVAGGLVGYNWGKIKDSFVGSSMRINADKAVGGLVGSSGGIYYGTATILNCESNAHVSASSSSAGGLVGVLLDWGIIKHSSSNGDVRGLDQIGGLVGNLFSNGSISESFASGNVYGDTAAGGLVGNAFMSYIDNSYARGDVSGNGSLSLGVGGLVGDLHEHSLVTNSYTTGKVTALQGVGGVVGTIDSSSSVSFSYFNQTLNPNLPSDDRGIGKTEQELKTLSTYLPQWDMTYLSDPSDSIWKIASPDGTGFPVLEWQL